MAGRFISLEGGEGAGKSTQARLLSDALEARGIRVLQTREPGGTSGAEAIRALLLDPAMHWNAEAEALLFAAARADHVSQAIRPALQDGQWVVCDRFIDSSRAYQGGAGGLSDDDVVTLHRIGSGGMLPDLTILIEIAPDEARERLAIRDAGQSDRIGGREAQYHADVAAAFRRLAEADPARFVRIEGHGTPEEIHARIMQAVEPLLGKAS
ncbi:dTMP kinase [Altererythrobacter atlanticus]|uniref:Thymidylate kinase n=2 Tax=Croceibacterium atlanticum TaxID=1267766 RepID=A0A0F7KQY8_9SPHN|nr:Thymidylate kinase [Croceibacterium atlanticum]MBB5733064.1 dTMP kinase [Croceibacterium atlanticum]